MDFPNQQFFTVESSTHLVGPNPVPVIATSVSLAIDASFKITNRVKIVLHKKNLRRVCRFLYKNKYPLATKGYNEKDLMIIIKHFMYMLIMHETDQIYCLRILAVFKQIGVPPGLLHLARIICSRQVFQSMKSVTIEYVVDDEWLKDISDSSITSLINALEDMQTAFHYIKSFYQDWSRIQAYTFRLGGIFEEMFYTEEVPESAIEVKTREGVETRIVPAHTVVKMEETLVFRYKNLAIDITDVSTLFFLLFMPSCLDGRNTIGIAFWAQIPYVCNDADLSGIEEILISCLEEYFKKDRPTPGLVRPIPSTDASHVNVATPHDQQVQNNKRLEEQISSNKGTNPKGNIDKMGSVRSTRHMLKSFNEFKDIILAKFKEYEIAMKYNQNVEFT